MQVGFLSVFLLVSSSLLFSVVVCEPNHHHHNNDFPWQNILSSLGITIENQTSVVSNTESSGEGAILGSKEHYTSESTVNILKSDTKDGTEIPVVAQNESTVGILELETTEGTDIPVVVQNGTTILSDGIDSTLNLGLKIGVPIVSIFLLILFWYCICSCCYACCCACCEEEKTAGVVVTQNTVEPQQPPIILHQPIIHQQVPPMYDVPPKWAHQWNQPPQGPTQWVPHPMGQHQQYSPNGGYDNAGFDNVKAPPPYNTRKY